MPMRDGSIEHNRPDDAEIEPGAAWIRKQIAETDADVSAMRFSSATAAQSKALLTRPVRVTRAAVEETVSLVEFHAGRPVATT
jgi:hypothetical protein